MKLDCLWVLLLEEIPLPLKLDSGLPGSDTSSHYVPPECSGGACGTPQWSCTTSTCKHSLPGNQVANYRSYACGEPQICPDMDTQSVRHDINTGGRELGFLLFNCSTGDRDLVLDRVQVLGDGRCAFSEVGEADISSKVVAPGDTAAIRIRYSPTAAGQDHAVVLVRSNAQNNPELRLHLCALAVDLKSVPPGGDWPGLASLRCQTSNSQASCHK